MPTSQDSAVAVLRSQLQSLQETHSAVLASSEQQADVHRRAEARGAQQLRSRLEELSRTRAQVRRPALPSTAAGCV